MKTIKNILLSIMIVGFSNSAFAQFSGKAYYQTQRKVDLKLDDAQMTEEQKQQMQAMLKKQFEKTYILSFNKEASVYQMEQELETPTHTAAAGGVRVMTLGGDADLVHYKNTKEERYAQEQDLFGKSFLIKDELVQYNWEFLEETKVIGSYLCFKAVAHVEEERISMTIDSDSSDEEVTEPEKVKASKTITAWYTSDIPITTGPGDFWGLPGLILELHDGEEMSYLCTKIIMNSKDVGAIKEPTSGKVVNRVEYQEILEKKMKEMQEQYSGRSRNGEEGSFSIRVGG